MKNIDFIDLEKNYSLCRHHEHNLVFQKGDGVWLWDVESAKFFDMTTLFNYAIFGHSPERLVNILIDQAKNLSMNTSFLYTDRLGPFLKKLSSMSNHSKCAAFSSTTQAYHELVRYSLQWSSHVKNLKAHEAQVAYVSSQQAQNSWHEEMATQILCHQKTYTFDDLEKIDEVGGKLSLLIIDPIDLNSDNLLISEEKLEKLRTLSKKHQCLLVLDESFCPPGAFGKNFVFNFFEAKHYDGVLLGEYLGAGLLPVCALALNQNIFEEAGPMTSLTSSVYPIGAAIALESLCLLEEMYLADKSEEKGDKVRKFLESRDEIKDVKSLGLIFKIEMNPHCQLDSLKKSFEKHSLFVHDIEHSQFLLSPALTISEQDLEWLLGQLDKVFLESKSTQPEKKSHSVEKTDEENSDLSSSDQSSSS